MKRLMRFLKPYRGSFLLAFILLIIMSNADLALPDYLSRIVNIGIQQNGLQSAVPEVIRTSEMDTLSVFQTDAEHQELLAAYHPVTAGSAEALALQKVYPGVAQVPVYAMNPTDEAGLSRLEALISKPLVLRSGINLAQADPERARQLLGDAAIDRMQALGDPNQLIEILKTFPPAQREAALGEAMSHLSTLEGNMLHQMAVRAVGAEYQALGADMQALQTRFTLSTGLVMVGLALLAAATSISVSFLAGRVSAGVARDLRQAVFTKVEHFSTAEFENFSTASLITRTTNDVSQVQNLLFMFIRMAMMAPMLAIFGVIRAIGKSPNMWWLIALAVSILLIVIFTILAIAVPRFKLLQELVDKINLVMRENLSGMLVVRAFNRQEFEEQRFDQTNKKLTGTLLFVGRLMSSLFPMMNIIMTSLNVFIIWVGAREVAQSTLQIGDLMAFQQYSMQIMFAFINLSMVFMTFSRASVSADRIADVLEEPIQIHDPAVPESFEKPVKGLVTFDDVSFRYPDAEEDVLHNISFEAQPGQVTTLIGSTGSGKSTIVNLIPRFFDVTKGRILVDGKDIRSVTQHELREQIGYTPQRALLFSGTVETNLQLGKPDATEEEMLEAIEIAQAADFVTSAPEGLDREIAQAGDNVSGGQKQRLSVARTVIKRPPIYIFDDTFSALDFKTDARLRAALERSVGDSTVLIVTQRVSTARNSDQILVLNDGVLVGKGSHADLMENCTTYREIANSQLTAEELA